ncbi:MAG: glycosyltransferase family 39 protein [Candidatus Omnitrophica bacterium]|nr:glycosyltransferase family 39 protein [Candidatus Omnitrophota bacterium]
MRQNWIFFAFIALSLFILTKSLGVHGLEFRDDEIFYFKSSQEMLSNHDLLNPTYFGENRFQKPILYYWLIIFSYKIFGVSWMAARLVAVVFGVMTVILTWDLARRLFDRQVAFLSAGVLMTIPLFFRHARNAVPDMPLNFFIVLAVWAGWRYLQEPKQLKFSFLFFTACAFGFMIKGFTAFIIPVMTIGIYALVGKEIKILKQAKLPLGLLLAFLIISPWFIYMGVKHGQGYIQYMLGNETKYRLLGASENSSIILNWLKFLYHHTIFYIQVIFSYFAPWSLFVFMAFPLALIRIRNNHASAKSLWLIIIWLSATIIFFSSLYFVINHYMLAISTPFAILVSYFLMESIHGSRIIIMTKVKGQAFILLFLLTIAFLAYSFIKFFLVETAIWLLPIFIISYIIMFIIIVNKKTSHLAPFVLVGMLLFVYAQSDLLVRSGIVSHAVLQKFAAVIHEQKEQELILSVGSNDIHEKELQVYFDEKIYKAATSIPFQTFTNLVQLYEQHPRVYTLMTESDYHDFLEMKPFKNVEIIYEDHIFRKRLQLDKGFVNAVFNFDKKKIYSYFMEKLLLVRRDQRA